MAQRRRALRDHGDARPLVALARAAMREAADATRAAREGLERYVRVEQNCRLIGGPGARGGPEDAESGA